MLEGSYEEETVTDENVILLLSWLYTSAVLTKFVLWVWKYFSLGWRLCHQPQGGWGTIRLTRDRDTGAVLEVEFIERETQEVEE